MNRYKNSFILSRRQALEVIGVTSLGLSTLACGDDDAIYGGYDNNSGSNPPSDEDETPDDGGKTIGEDALNNWVTSGTVGMTALASYPDPFQDNIGTSCNLICETTIGPCHTTSPEREDISNNYAGIPMRVAIRVVDESCNPVPDAIVELWHTNPSGVYSGEINQMCNDEEEDRQDNYFRGYLRTDAAGKVFFNSCFPGWYRGRAIHIHFRIMTGAYDAEDNAQASVITQLLWEDELVSSIFDSVDGYKDWGQPDTLLGTDNVLGGEDDFSPYLFDVQRMEDGAMLVSKTLVIRSALSADLCATQGLGNRGGMRPPGGMPPPDGEG